MKIDIITIFPQMFEAVFSNSIIKIARQKKLIDIRVHDLRDYTDDKHRKVDATVYGGGPGMVLQCQPLFAAVKSIIAKSKVSSSRRRILLLSPQGRKLNQKRAVGFLEYKQLLIICGRYEGVDERVRLKLIDEEISIGDYVLSGGELPAMIMTDVITRLIPGVVGNYESVQQESFQEGLLDYPHYTKPRVFEGLKVPEVLLSGDHNKIALWRKKEAIKRTKLKRPDLLKNKKVAKIKR